MPGWGQRPLFRNPTNMTQGGSVGMPKGIAGYQTGGDVLDPRRLMDSDPAMLDPRRLMDSDPAVLDPRRLMDSDPAMLDPRRLMDSDGYPNEAARARGMERDATQSAYENAIQSSAASFAKSSPGGLTRGENKELDTLAMNISYGHNREKQEVLQDLIAAIEQQSANMPPEQGIMDMIREKLGGSTEKGMMHGGIVGLQDGGMAPELFEDEGIVDTSSMLNEMAAQESGDGIMSMSARGAPEAMPERGVPNERGIIELAMEPELAEEVEDDNPILAFAKQEAQSRLDEEFNILKSTAQAEAASGNPPSAVIKSSMDDLARSARRIETETVEKYPEVPMNANLISSDDLVSYREELVTIFETPEVGQEEPLMDMSILTAKRGGLIPGYQDGGEVPEEWSWIDEDIRQSGVSLKEAESIMIKKYGPEVAKMRKMYATETDPETLTKRRVEERLLPADELIKRRTDQSQDTRIADLVEAMKTGNFMGSTEPKKIPLPGGTGTATMPMGADTIRSNMDLLRQYGKSFNEEGNLRPMVETSTTSSETKYPENLTLEYVMDQSAVLPREEALALHEEYFRQQDAEDPFTKGPVTKGTEALPFQGNGQDIAAILKATKEAGYSEETALELIKMMQQGDPLADVKAQGEALKKTTQEGIGSVTSILNQSIKDYGDEAKKQDETMRNIFDDIERRIPEQAKYASLTSAASSAGGKGTQYWTRKFNRKSFEENLYQTNNKNKIEFENLRKKETEARRNQDIKALYDIKLKQYELLSGIDKSMWDAEATLAQSKIENNMAIELELLKARVGTKDPSSSTPAAVWADLVKSVGKNLIKMEGAIETMLTSGEANANFIASQNVNARKSVTLPGKADAITGTLGDLIKFLKTETNPETGVMYSPIEIISLWQQAT